MKTEQNKGMNNVSMIYTDLDLNQKINFKAYLNTHFDFVGKPLIHISVNYRISILVPMVEMYPHASYKMRMHIGIITQLENMCIPGYTIQHVSTSLDEKGGFGL